MVFHKILKVVSKVMLGRRRKRMNASKMEGSRRKLTLPLQRPLCQWHHLAPDVCPALCTIKSTLVKPKEGFCSLK